MDSAHLHHLSTDLDAASYRLNAIRARIGADTLVSLQRGVFAPARQALQSAPIDALSAQIRLLMLGESVNAAMVGEAFPTLTLSGALELGLISGSGDQYRAALSLNALEFADPLDPHTTLNWWIISDLDDHLRDAAAGAQHVMGVAGATRSLIAQAPIGAAAARPVRRALDLGTGCGIIALMLAAAGVPEVVASDISARALTLARANETLNAAVLAGRQGAPIEFRQGSLFEPWAGDQFDLILSNPPFVITPRGHDLTPRYDYRDGGLVGDALAQSVVEQGPRYLREQGTLLLLANWESAWGEDGLARVRHWIEAAQTETVRVSSWVIERDRVTPAQYAQTWVRDGGARPGTADFETLMQAWLDDFSQRRIVAIGLGSIRVTRRSVGAANREVTPTADFAPSATDSVQVAALFMRAEQVLGSLAESPAAALTRIWDEGLTVEGLSDAEILNEHWRAAAELREIREYAPGSEHPRAIALHLDEPLARIVTADTLLAAAVGACDGELSLEEIARALGQLLGVEGTAVAESLVPEVRELVWLGMLHRAER